jgi:hypothetical protein
MQKSHLFAVFQSLELPELHDVAQWVRSPVHNQRQDIVDLLDYFTRHRRVSDPFFWRKEQVFTCIFPGEDYEEKKIRYTMAFLSKAIAQCLAYRAFIADTGIAELYLSKVYRRKGLEQAAEKSIREGRAKLEVSSLRDTHFLYKAYIEAMNSYEQANLQSRDTLSAYRQVLDAWLQFSAAERLRLACSGLSHTALTNSLLSEEMLEEALMFAGKAAVGPALQLYTTIFRVLRSPEGKDHFVALKAQLADCEIYFEKQELKNIYLLAINYCIRQINSGQKQFLEEVFALYNRGLGAGFFLENGIMSRFTFNNIVNAGLGLKAFDWTEQFIHRYRDHIEARYRDNTFHYNLAILYYRKPDYNKAMELLRVAVFDDIHHQLDARRMLLKIYYESDATDALSSLLDSFKVFIYRQKAIGAYKSHYLNLIRFTKKLLRLDFHNRREIAALRQEIQATEALAEREWLLGCLE